MIRDRTRTLDHRWTVIAAVYRCCAPSESSQQIWGDSQDSWRWSRSSCPGNGHQAWSHSVRYPSGGSRCERRISRERFEDRLRIRLNFPNIAS
jgi:hypothetical protein